ncbi:flagellar transcriptional regulator FlhD [Halomonas sp. I5-271120]|uniref:flagellar transcriptional regulator FlhD n=1 Tax=Halomonas sp. I5-271120 TaxID=3061632 RepID=UPI0027147C20|nr:flagellar transcriptional regulator FlhD [Halomonas sp. I5-271120]
MDLKQIDDAIEEANLSFLILAQQLIECDMSRAALTLGLERQVLERIANLTPRQMSTISKSPFLLMTVKERGMDVLDTPDKVDDQIKAFHHSILMLTENTAS